MQIFHFFYHTRIDAGFEALCNALTQFFPQKRRTDDKRTDVGTARHRLSHDVRFRAHPILRYLYRPYAARFIAEIFARVEIRFQRKQKTGKLFEGFRFEFGTPLFIFRHFDQIVISDNRVEVHAGAADDDGQFFPADDIRKDAVKILLILKYAVFAFEIGYVDKVIRNGNSARSVFVQIFSRTDVETLVHLPRIRRNDFTVPLPRDRNSYRRFAAGGRPQKDDAVAALFAFRHSQHPRNRAFQIFRSLIAEEYRMILSRSPLFQYLYTASA